MTRTELAVKKLHNDLKNKYVLEAACGRADFSVCAAKTAARAECIDVDETRLVPEFASVQNAAFHLMDVTSMTYDSEKFDTVVLYEAIGHLDYVLEQSVKECLRVLKKQGCLIIVSSSKMDKRVIENKLIPLLNSRKQNYVLEEEKIFTFVRIVKRKVI